MDLKPKALRIQECLDIRVKLKRMGLETEPALHDRVKEVTHRYVQDGTSVTLSFALQGGHVRIKMILTSNPQKKSGIELNML